MRVPNAIDSGGREATSISIGGAHASAKPHIVRTVLGSCIAVCLRDPIQHIGGMNHFMLPRKLGVHGNPAAYGVHAMELLINECMRLGALRGNLEAKVFGGAHVLKTERSTMNVPEANIDFALQFLRDEQIPVIKMDVGGYAGREVFFFTDSGRTLVRKLLETGSEGNEQTRFERESLHAKRAAEKDKNVTLFD